MLGIIILCVGILLAIASFPVTCRRNVCTIMISVVCIVVGIWSSCTMMNLEKGEPIVIEEYTFVSFDVDSFTYYNENGDLEKKDLSKATVTQEITDEEPKVVHYNENYIYPNKVVEILCSPTILCNIYHFEEGYYVVYLPEN